MQATSKKFTESIYTGALDADGNTYVARVFWSHVIGVRASFSP